MKCSLQTLQCRVTLDICEPQDTQSELKIVKIIKYCMYKKWVPKKYKGIETEQNPDSNSFHTYMYLPSFVNQVSNESFQEQRCEKLKMEMFPLDFGNQIKQMTLVLNKWRQFFYTEYHHQV